jgi:hypothetical protein
LRVKRDGARVGGRESAGIRCRFPQVRILPREKLSG